MRKIPAGCICTNIDGVLNLSDYPFLMCEAYVIFRVFHGLHFFISVFSSKLDDVFSKRSYYANWKKKKENNKGK